MFVPSKITVLALAVILFVASAFARPYGAVVSFGDSLSDTTNNPATGDYWEGRYSNGPLWDEYLATNFGAALYDFAYSGSETSALAAQVAAALAYSWDDTNTLFTVWSGGNDFIDSAAANGTSLAAWDGTINTGVANLSNAVATLAQAGARFIVVPNLPDLSQLPVVRTNPLLEIEAPLIRQLVANFNNDLASAMEGVAKKHPNVRIAWVDDFTLVDNISAHPSNFQFTVVDNDALDAFSDPTFTGPGADYLFWDVIHPTTKAHGLVAQMAESAVSNFAPSIVIGPANETVAVGSVLTLSASVLDATNCQWFFNKRKIPGATNATYEIASVSAGKAGEYAVEAFGPVGSVSSAAARVIVDAPVKITKEPLTQNGIEGRAVTLGTHATGTAPLHYQWQFDGTNIAGATKASLALTKIQASESGSYMVTVTNAVSSVPSAPAVLSVIAPPHIVTPPASITATNGATVTFSVLADGTAPFHYQWEHNGASIHNQTNSTYSITNIAPKQKGNYRVLVRNAAGSVVSSNAVLKVELAP